MDLFQKSVNWNGQRVPQKRVGILLPRLDRWDATGNDAVAMRNALESMGLDARLFADGGNNDQRVYSWKKITRFLQDPSDILLYHFSTAWDPAVELIQSGKFKKIIKYHNVTPADFFEPYNPAIARVSTMAREQLQKILKARPDLVLADSEFNASEILDYGFDPDRVQIVPPFHKISPNRESWTESFDWDFFDRFGMGFPGDTPMVLTVGRVVPNKGHLFLLDSFSRILEEKPGAKLVVIGSRGKGFEDYFSKIQNLLKEKKLSGSVLFAGSLPGPALKTAYLTARVFAMTSFHEGFCVPAIEAMAYGLPLVSLKNGALADTIGDAGILVENQVEEFSKAMLSVLNSTDVSKSMADAGIGRFTSEFQSSVILKKFIQAMGPHVE